MSEEPSPAKVVQVLDVNRASLRKINPASSGHTAIVYLTRRGSYELATSKLTMGELWLSTPTEMYSVDLTPHDDTFDLELPSKQEAFRFPAKVHVIWRISDPIVAVQRKLTEPLPQIKQYLEEKLRTFTRNFAPDHNAKAEEEIRDYYHEKTIVMSPALVIERCGVLLDPEVGLREHVVEMQKGAYAGEQKTRRVQVDLALKTQRMNMYAEALRTDNVNMLALVLAGHGQDARDVIKLVMNQKQERAHDAHRVLETLLQENLINRHDVREMMSNAAKTVSNQVSEVSPLDASQPEVPEGRPAPLHVTTHRMDEDDEDEDDEDDDDR